MRSTTSAPSKAWRRRKITGDDRITSFDHCRLTVSTSSTRRSSFTFVTRSKAGPTAAFHAKVTLPSDSGEPRSSSTSAPGRPAEMGSIRSYYCTVRLILASASPRRAELLRAAGYTFGVVVADVDESIRAGETPQTYVRRLAAEKSNAALKRCVSDLAALKDCTTDLADLKVCTTDFA